VRKAPLQGSRRSETASMDRRPRVLWFFRATLANCSALLAGPSRRRSRRRQGSLRPPLWPCSGSPSDGFPVFELRHTDSDDQGPLPHACLAHVHHPQQAIDRQIAGAAGERPDGLDVPTRLDLELDPDVPLGQIGPHGVEQSGTESMTPPDKPAGTLLRVAPSARAKETPCSRSSAASTTVSRAALAIRCLLHRAGQRRR
jgi:hypothetical protein